MSNGIAVSALLVGAVGFVLALIPLLGIVVGAVAVALGLFALREGQSRSFALLGAVLGAAAVVASIVLIISLSSLNVEIVF